MWWEIVQSHQICVCIVSLEALKPVTIGDYVSHKEGSSVYCSTAPSKIKVLFASQMDDLSQKFRLLSRLPFEVVIFVVGLATTTQFSFV
jgi:hypothetical protein